MLGRLGPGFLNRNYERQPRPDAANGLAFDHAAVRPPQENRLQEVGICAVQLENEGPQKINVAVYESVKVRREGRPVGAGIREAEIEPMDATAEDCPEDVATVTSLRLDFRGLQEWIDAWVEVFRQGRPEPKEHFADEWLRREVAALLQRQAPVAFRARSGELLNVHVS